MYAPLRKVLQVLSYLPILLGFSAHAQSLQSAMQLRNSHLWRGLEVATGLVYTGNLELTGENFYGGFWGGGNATGTYTEFDYYIGYKNLNKRVKVELWDIYNFSPEATYNNTQYFNYSRAGTGRFWDFRSYYTISKRFPLELSFNSVVFGRDRNLDNTQNKFSYFASIEYPFLRRNDLAVRGRVGYADALRPSGEPSNFFATNRGFSEVSLIIEKKLPVGTWEIPLGFWAMWNTVDQNAFLQFSVQLFSF